MMAVWIYPLEVPGTHGCVLSLCGHTTWTDLADFGFFSLALVFPLPLPSCALSLPSSRQPEVSWVSQYSELRVSSPCICLGSRWPETPPSSCCLGTLHCTGLSFLSRSRGIFLGLSTEGFGLSETGLGTEQWAQQQTSHWVFSQNPHHQGFFRGHIYKEGLP